MNYGTFFQRETRGILWDVLLALVFGGILFAALVIATGGVLVSLVTAAVAMGAFGLFHYWIWGQALSKEVAREREQAEARARPPSEPIKPADEFTLILSEQEREALIDVLERSEARPTPRADGKRPQQQETIREMLARLRGFGA